MDWVSSLPDEIVCHILSFLSTKETVLTSLLSKRWRNLFAFSPNLRFEEEDFVCRHFDFDIPLSFLDFLDRLLVVSGNFPLQNFSLACRKYVDSAHTNRWICNVLSRGFLEHLQVRVCAKPKHMASLPLEIFTCKTLVTLKLGLGFDIPMIPENASLPALKTLYLDDIRFSNPQVCGFEALLSACTVLEELLMFNVKTVNFKHCIVYSPTLDRLTMSFNNPPSLTFDTPSLAYFRYCDYIPKVSPIVNLESLVEAKLCLLLSSQHPIPTSIENLIKGLRNVQILEISTFNTMKSLYAFREAIPVFKNLLHLSIATVYFGCCRALPVLLKNAPNLETLVIKGLLHYTKEPDFICECLSGYSCLFPCRVKVLEIILPGKDISLLSYKEINMQMGQLKQFLAKLSCLELVKVRSRETDENEKLRLTMDIQNIPRSSKCKIQLEFIPPS